MGRHVQVVAREVIGRHGIVIGLSHGLKRRLPCNAPMTEGLEIAPQIHGIIACRQRGCELARGGGILHHQVHRPSDAIAFHVGRERLAHLQPVEHLRREHVERHKAVLVVGAGYLHPVHQRIVIPLVHATKDGILSFPAAVPLHRNPRHSSYGIGHSHIRRKFHCPGAHHIEYTHRLLLQLARTSLTAAAVVRLHGHRIQRHAHVLHHEDYLTLILM